MTIKKNQYIGIILVVVILAAFYALHVVRKNSINDNNIQTVAYVNGYFRSAKSGPALKYIYRVDSNKHEGSAYIDEAEFSKYKNHFFELRYARENPDWSEILLNRPVTDTVAIKAAGFSLPKKKTNQFQEP